jgi:tetratricopeptide (TPR) repeat protein
MLPEEAPSLEQTEITPETEQPQMVSELQPITGEEPPQIIESTAQLEEEMLPETIQTPTTIAQVSEIVTITEESKLQTAEEKLQEAQAELAKGKLQSALEKYSELIESEIFLEQTIHDIRDALYRYPLDIGLWQVLGDAYLRGNRLQDALDAYTKAEELIR